MTDNEIIKAFKICNDLDEVGFCKDCPHECVERCIRYTNQKILDLINRLQAENERLIGDVMTYKTRWAKAEVRETKAKTQAYKEFAERLKEKLRCSPQWICHRENYKSYGFSYDDVFSGIDNLLKELIGE
jgi:hypothetical protein